MTNKFILTVLTSLFAVTANISQASVTFSYQAQLYKPEGTAMLHAELFPLGERFNISYTLDTTILDSDAALDTGIFEGAVQSLSISIPKTGVQIDAGSGGQLLLWNNFESSTGFLTDQVSLGGGPSASFLGSDSVDQFWIHFYSKPFPISGNPPSMLTSDSMPLSQISFFSGDLYFFTASRWTGIAFGAMPAPVPEPSTYLLFAGGLGAILVLRKKFPRNNAHAFT